MLNNKLNDIELYKIIEETKHYEDKKAASIEALKIVQNSRGWISDQLMYEISAILCISVSQLEEIATFYSQIYRQPVGRNIIKYCDSVVCYMMGCNKIQLILEDILKIKPGCTTIDHKFTLLPISCLGNCDKAPVLMINSITYSNVNSTCIPILLEKCK
ncbi:NADH-quinone oxidoreductase subunit NuoE [Buchnera aphidicola]|uniref:NADH-quinone oxidoreductase subunit E n=1 Tax=Buchnera aphidicola (Sarucallis kahawaluokalani) TaxID=1241878 RepID=A0A4D6YCM0_9GAMM|nr:NADH-quinone oxidoreductase subunit NuoE [Buchnera aphidicola]QCI25913.1 NADH-quinone oxidoreductase subunit NuoE [Buchnera aphidicola (Sarucallis kahawaluokalani)]